MIEIDGLVKWYGPAQALKGISTSLQQRQVLGFLGPNGAGKSTTMKILTGYLLPDEGRASVGGFDVVKRPTASKRLVGYLPEHNPLYHEMSVIDFLDFVARGRGVRRDQLNRRIAEAIEAVALGEMLHKGIGELSKGFRQRVGLAQALVHDPEVLILDEPTSGLDPNQRAEILRLIRRIGREKTVIHSTHVLDEVRLTCDRIIVIHRGAIVADGTPSEIVDHHQSEQVLRVVVDATDRAVRLELEHMAGVVSVTEADAPMEADLTAAKGDEEAAADADEVDGGSSRARKRRAKKKGSGAGIPSAKRRPSHDHDRATPWLVTLKEGVDLRREVFQLARDKNWDLLELAPQRLSLDEVFRRLTRD
jgi:ABC-2 type transport system ATP-binding protein